MRPRARHARMAALAAAGALAIAVPAVCAEPQETEKSHSAGSGHGGAESIALWKLANFILLAGIGGWLIAKKGGGFYRARTEEIQRGIAEASRMREDAEARFKEMERRLAALGTEIENLRKRAEQEWGAESDRLRRQAEESVRKIQAQAEQEIAAAGKSARQSLRAYSAELAVRLAGDKLRQRLTPDADAALVEAAIHELRRRPRAESVRVS